MLNEGAVVTKEEEAKVLKVLDGVQLEGEINTHKDILLENIKSSVRRGVMQVRPQSPNMDRVAIVGGGPSLNDPQVQRELRDLIWSGAKLVTVNGAYHWCIERNLQPRTQIIMDAQEHNARFVDPPVPECRYVIASQCHPKVWDALTGRPGVFIFHGAEDSGSPIKEFLDAYYRKQWYGVGGATTVVTRAIAVLRMLGYLRFDLFGVDSCWMDGKHHAYDQPENNRDRRKRVTVEPPGHPELGKTFICSPWHMKQAEDFLQVIRINGDNFLLTAHGDGMIAHLLRSGADAVIREQEDSAGIPEQDAPSE